MTYLKHFILAVVLGLLGYEAIKILVDGVYTLPSSQAELSSLAIIIAIAFAASLLGSQLQGATSGRESGTVKWFNVRKGYGFITRDQGDDIFVHFRNIEGQGRRAISEGQRVTFIVTNGEKGLQADKVVGL